MRGGYGARSRLATHGRAHPGVRFPRVKARTRIGISGWTYAPWRGVFYPGDLPRTKELAFASQTFPTIEINGTHYSLQTPASFRRWRDTTPEDFVFSVKGSRYITHMRRLRNVRTPLANFFASGVLELREKLGPILWQFPPSFRFDAGSFRDFLEMLPATTEEATRIAKRHDGRLRARASLRGVPGRRIRHCIEARHDSFLVPEFFRLLRRHCVAFVFADTAGRWPYAEDLTSDFVYVRLHGDKEIYVSGYTASALADWASRIHAWKQGHARPGAPLVTAHRNRRIREIFVYFDNDVKVKAPSDALALSRLAAT